MYIFFRPGYTNNYIIFVFGPVAATCTCTCSTCICTCTCTCTCIQTIMPMHACMLFYIHVHVERLSCSLIGVHAISL